MSEQEPGSVGQILRDARTAQSLSRENVAVRLHLMQRQIDAMEADDFASLGQAVFARGFVRNYARLLGLAPEPLLARMAGAPVESAMVSPLPSPSSRSWLASPWMLLLLLGVLVLVALPLALYGWLTSEADAPHAAQQPVAPSAPAIALKPVPAPLPLAVPTAVPEPAATMPVVDAPVSSPAIVVEPLDTAKTGAPATPASTVSGGALHLGFDADSWTEIRDASGKVLLRKLNVAGSRVDIQGTPPFNLVIGNAAQVKLSYNSRLIDLKPFVEGSVARFTLEE